LNAVAPIRFEIRGGGIEWRNAHAAYPSGTDKVAQRGAEYN